MSTDKQKLYNEIETLLPTTIKNKKDLKEKLQKGLDDIKEGKVYSIEETFEELDNI